MLDINSRTAVVENDGGAVSIIFYFDDILDMSDNYYNTYPTAYKLSFYYGNHNIFEHVIDERYDYDVCDASSITWYREGYIMFRYMYNKNKVGMFYNKTTGEIQKLKAAYFLIANMPGKYAEYYSCNEQAYEDSLAEQIDMLNMGLIHSCCVKK